MKTWNTIKGQSLIDLAIQLYGNEDAVTELLSLNDLTGKFELSGPVDADEIDIAFALKENTAVKYDENSALINTQVLLQLAHPLFGLRMQPIATADGINADVFADEFADEFA